MTGKLMPLCFQKYQKKLLVSTKTGRTRKKLKNRAMKNITVVIGEAGADIFTGTSETVQGRGQKGEQMDEKGKRSTIKGRNGR